MEQQRANKSVDEAQHTAPHNAPQNVSLKAGEGQLQGEQMKRKHIGSVWIHHGPEKTNGVQHNDETTDQAGMFHHGGWNAHSKFI